MAKHPPPQQGSPWARVLVPWLAGAARGGPNSPLSAGSEIKLSVTAAAADCIVDAVLGDLTIAQCKLVSCQRLQDGDVGWGSGLRQHCPGTSQHCDRDLLSGKQDNSHPGNPLPVRSQRH